MKMRRGAADPSTLALYDRSLDGRSDVAVEAWASVANCPLRSVVEVERDPALSRREQQKKPNRPADEDPEGHRIEQPPDMAVQPPARNRAQAAKYKGCWKPLLPQHLANRLRVLQPLHRSPLSVTDSDRRGDTRWGDERWMARLRSPGPASAYVP
jgi:hypothetical protein